MRAVSHILQGKDDRAKAIREILDLFLPRFSNPNKDLPILIDLQQGLSPSVVGTGVSILTDLYFDIEIKKETYERSEESYQKGLLKSLKKLFNNKNIASDKECISKGIQREFETFLNSTSLSSEQQRKTIHEYNLELENLSEFTQITSNLFMSCVILEINKRSGILDFDLFRKSEIYFEHCMKIVNLFLQRVNVNETVIPNPVFGCMEHGILGDGDFILDGNLYDIKTTKSIKVNKNSRRQLLFYYLLNNRCSIPFSDKSEGTMFDISKLYIYKARHGVSIEIPIKLRGAKPLDIIKIISEIEIGKITPSEGIDKAISMLKEELDPKPQKIKLEPKKNKIIVPKEKVHIFKVKKAFMCNDTGEVFDSIRKANEKHGYSKNAIYRQLKGGKYTTTRDGHKYTWRVIYKIV